MRLRPYQEEAVDATVNTFTNQASALLVMATGLGKTVVLSALAAQWKRGRILVVAHREELVSQAHDKLDHWLRGSVAIEMAGDHTDETRPARAVVASVQTLVTGRAAKFKPDDFGLVVIDEAHHAVASTYRRVISYFAQNPEMRLLGVTATPKRADELAMGQVFDSVSYDYGIEPAIGDGWLVPVHQHVIKVEGLDFSKARTVAKDFNEADLEKILIEEKILHQTVAPMIELAGDRPTLVFACTVKHAELLAAVIDRYKRDSVAAISGKTPKDVRRKLIDRFKRGEIQFLVNCAIFLEGFDAPTTAVVAMARPTKSLSLYTQILGRGTRPLPGIVDGLETPDERKTSIADSAKPGMFVLDFAGNAGRHQIVTAQDVLGGKYGQPVREYARQTVSQENRPASVEQSLARAADELALLDEIRERERKRAIIAKAQFRATSVSPFGGMVPPGMAPQASARQPGDEPTDKQVWFLVRAAGWNEQAARRLTKRQASAIIGKIKEAG